MQTRETSEQGRKRHRNNIGRRNALAVGAAFLLAACGRPAGTAETVEGFALGTVYKVTVSDKAPDSLREKVEGICAAADSSIAYSTPAAAQPHQPQRDRFAQRRHHPQHRARPQCQRTLRRQVRHHRTAPRGRLRFHRRPTGGRGERGFAAAVRRLREDNHTRRTTRQAVSRDTDRSQLHRQRLHGGQDSPHVGTGRGIRTISSMWAARFSAAASIPPANAGTSPSTPPMRKLPSRRQHEHRHQCIGGGYRHLRQLPQFPHGARRTEIHAHHRPYDGRKCRKQPAFGHRRGGGVARSPTSRDGDNVHGTGTGRVAGPAGGTSRIRRPAHLCRRNGEMKMHISPAMEQYM